MGHTRAQTRLISQAQNLADADNGDLFSQHVGSPNALNESEPPEPSTSVSSASSLSSDVEPSSSDTESQSVELDATHSELNSQNLSQDPQTIKIMACKRSESRCFLCQSGQAQEGGSRSRIPKAAVRDAWTCLQVYIPPTNRCCPKHIANGVFTDEAKFIIRTTETEINVTTANFFDWLTSITQIVHQKPSIYDFGSNSVPENKFETLLGVTKPAFNELCSYMSPEMRNTSERSIPNAVAMMLMLLRTGCTQELLAYCFETEQRVVSDAINAVSTLLDKKFVPENLGIHHVTLEEVTENHGRETFRHALNLSEGTPLIIADGGYVYIQKPSNLEDQRTSWSDQKKRNFFRFMLTVLPSGHILDAQGPFPAIWNDAKVLPIVINEGVCDLLGPSPAILLDRGFLHCEEELKTKGFQVFTPEWLKKNEKQFNTVDGNTSRLVTMSRWPVESTFGNIAYCNP